MGKSSDRWGYGLLIVAIASAVGLCVPALRGQSLALDEHVSYFCSGAPSVWELWKRCDDVAVLPPLSHVLERAALAIGGHSESVFRLPSLLAYVLAVPVVWWAGRLAGGPVAGGLAALIVAWHPAVLDEVRFARCYGLVLLLASLSTGSLLRWLVEPQCLRWVAAWVLTATALCWTHYLAAPLVAAQAGVLIVTVLRLSDMQQRRCGAAVLCGIVAVAVACLPLGHALFRLREWSGLIEFQRVPSSIAQALGAAWTLPALAAVAVSILWQRSGNVASAKPGQARDAGVSIAWPLVLWLVPLVVIGGMALAGSPMLASPRYRVMVVPASAVAMGMALSRAFVPPIAGILAAGLLVLSTFIHGSSPRIAGRLANRIEEEWKRVGLELRPSIDDPPVLVFTQSGLAESILLPALPSSDRLKTYVACRLGGFYTGSERALPIPILWDARGPLRNQYASLLKRRGLRTVWIIGASDTDLNAESVTGFATFIQSMGFQLAAAESRPGITVLKFEATDGRSVGTRSEK